MFKTTLFGTPLLNIRGENLSDAITGRSMALFVYLSVTGVPHDRSTLADLLWDDVSEHKARTNLRYVLYSLRKVIGAYLTVSRHTIKFNHQAPYWLDTEAFASYLSLNQMATMPSAANLDLLQKAVDLYQGDFLAGFYIQNASVFEEWMLVQREQLRQEVVQGLSDLVTAYSAQNKYDLGLKANKRLIELEPWNEEAHRQLMRLLAYSGQRSAALSQYATCRRVLENEYGADPLPETQQLYEQIRAGSLSRPNESSYREQDDTIPVIPTQDISSSSLLHDFPAPLDAFIGRKKELAAINQSIQNPYGRLITVVGPGGIGKTRVVQEAIQQGQSTFQNASLFSDGIYYIPLINNQSQLEYGEAPPLSKTNSSFPQTIATAIGYTSQSTLPIAQQLQHELADKQILFILDNFEYDLSDVQWLISTLHRAPNLKILITTRRRLNIQGEQTFTLTGLSTSATGLDLESDEAVSLFLERAKGIDWRFEPTVADVEQIKRICQLVNGSPLAIELAAQWLRAFDCATIAKKLGQSLDFLIADTERTENQHYTLRSMFEDSWQLLTDQEQNLLIHLSTFKNSFSSESVQIAGQISIPLLLQLLDRSFLRSVEGGMFEIDRLMYPYIAEKQKC